MGEEDEEVGVPKKKNVFALFLISVITLGVYPAIWYIERQNELNNLNTSSKLGRFISALPLLLVIVIIFFILMGIFFGTTVWVSDVESVSATNQFPLSFTIWFVLVAIFVLLFILFYIIILPFKVRKILNLALINKGSNAKLSGFLTLVFNVFYLQYEINRITDDKEENKRKAPWFIFIVFLAIAATVFTIIFLYFPERLNMPDFVSEYSSYLG